MMKKFGILLLTLALICGAALADTVDVTITNGQGEICLARESVEVTDVDGDGALTICDALYCAHEAYFNGGADAGFATEDQGYGPSLTMLWGEENGGSYGYCVNNVPAVNLADPIAEGDHIHAYAYQDLEAWSDQFSYFQVTDGDERSLTLVALGYDADWNVVTSPLAGAAVTVDGEDSGLVTDENGAIEITDLNLTESGVHVISASCADAVIVPPVFTITVAVAE